MLDTLTNCSRLDMVTHDKESISHPLNKAWLVICFDQKKCGRNDTVQIPDSESSSLMASSFASWNAVLGLLCMEGN